VSLKDLLVRPDNFDEKTLAWFLVLAQVTTVCLVVLNFLENNWLTSMMLLVMLVILIVARINLKVQERHWVTVVGTCVIPSVVLLVAVVRQPEYAHYWAFVIIIFYYYLLPLKRAWQFNFLYFCLVAAASWQGLESSVYTRFVASMMVCSLFIFSLSRSLNEKNALLKRLATEDALTGIANRRLMDQRIKAWVALTKRHPNEVASLALIDLDLFKLINDQYGHAVGDDVLKLFAKALQRRARGSDLFARCGGEEFALFMPRTHSAEATTMIEALKTLIASLNMPKNVQLTFSAGVCEFKPEYSYEQWLACCDKALYQAKETGRNCIVNYDKV
jgi:diguanylate cyclase (GGDEF)-like protein